MGGMTQQGFNTPGPSSGWGGQNPGFNPTGGIFDFNPAVTAGLSPLEQQGMGVASGLPFAGAGQYGQAQQGLQGLMGGQLPQQSQEAMDLYRQMPGIGQQQVTGEYINKDPAYQSALSAVQSSLLPTIGNQAALSGLGRSAPAMNAMASAQSQYMMPIITDALAREERDIGRHLGATGQAAAGLMGGGAMNQQGQIAGTQGMMNLGNQYQQNALNSVQAMMGAGALPRQLDQQQNDAMRDEWMRIMATGENAMGSPLGMLPSFLGGSSTSSKK